MKILHVAESAKGGVGTYISELAARQAESAAQGDIRVLVPADHAFQVARVPAGSIITYPRPDRSPRSLLNLARALKQAMEEDRPDVIHAHSTFAGIVVRALYGWRQDRPAIVYCPHGWSFDVRAAGWKRKLAAALERALAPLCDRIIAISVHEGRVARKAGIPRSKIEVVRNGLWDVEAVEQEPWDDDRLKVLFVGRLDRQKGFDTFIDSLAPLSHRLSVRIAGQAVTGTHLPEKGATVEMLGWLSEPEIRSHLAAADVLVVPSRWEGFGLVALEAMRASRMVIASHVGGLTEVVQDGVTGLLVPPDLPDALARRLSTLTREQARHMGVSGRRHFLTFFQGERMHRQLDSVYRRCLTEPMKVAF